MFGLRIGPSVTHLDSNHLPSLLPCTEQVQKYNASAHLSRPKIKLSYQNLDSLDSSFQLRILRTSTTDMSSSWLYFFPQSSGQVSQTSFFIATARFPFIAVPKVNFNSRMCREPLKTSILSSYNVHNAYHAAH